MKVILLNGSPHVNGCTKRALTEVATALNEENIETEIIDVSSGYVGCKACNACSKIGRCAINDGLNEISEKVKSADGLIIGAPVYYASPNGNFIAFLDRIFCSSKGAFSFKVGASVVSARRGGTTASLDVLNKYFLISNMVMPGSSYWNMVHGNTPEEVEQDKEGLQTMRQLGKNTAWVIKALKSQPTPIAEAKIRTNFTR